MIRITDFHKRFNAGTANEVYALKGIDLHVTKGDFVTIIGTNGSGKSTLLNGVAGSFLPDAGTITISGKDVTFQRDFERARYISRVFQNPYTGTAPGMTIAENLLMASLRGDPHYPRISLNKGLMARFQKEVALLEMHLETRLEDVIGTLSGGQRQALTLLMAVIRQPNVLLLDEHTAALDPKSSEQVIGLTRRFIDEGQLTTLMVTHSMRQALELGTRTVMMHQGRIIEDIPKEEKRHLTVEDLLDRFADLRKRERLTDDILEQLRREYL
jgi:putative tryptophan/tyrosine transport system ATP-binding protein